MAVQAPPRPGQPPQKGQAPPPPAQPFPVGVFSTGSPDYDEAKVIVAGSTTTMPNHSFEPTGWLSGFEVQVDATGGVNGSNTVAISADAPDNVIHELTIKDVGNRQVFGPVGGFDIRCINKFGGYHALGDPAAKASFGAVSTGASGTGNFSYVFWIPMELVARDALGTVENKSSSSAWKLELVLEDASVVYTTKPGTLPSVRVRITEDGYTEPGTADAHGRPLSQTPPAPGTLQYWVSEDDTMPSGTASYNVENGIGYSIRNLIFKYIETSGGTRAAGDADWPDPLTITYGKVVLDQLYKNTWIDRMARDFRLSSVTADAGLGRLNGVFPYWFTKDFGLEPGAELRNRYLVTKTGTVLKVKGSWGAAGTLYTLVNYVIPPSNDPGRLRAGR